MTPLGFARLYNSPKPYCSPLIIIQGNFHLFKYPRERFDTFFAIFFADSKSRAQELSNDVSFVIFGYQTLDLEGGGGKLTPPDVSWFSSTPAGIGLRNYCVFYFIILTHFMVISIINVLKSNHRAIKFWLVPDFLRKNRIFPKYFFNMNENKIKINFLFLFLFF